MSTPWQSPDQPPVPTAAPQVPQLPRYGEMAPPGYVSPVPQPIVEAQSQEAPVYFAAPPVVRKPRTADVIVTCILLAFGLIGMLLGLSIGLNISSALAAQYEHYGVSYTPAANLGTVSAIIVVSHIVLYLAAVGVSIPLMIKRRVSFWVPLVAGFVAGAIMWGLLISIIVSDPRLMDAVTAGR
jgi:Family of unknown function (DUF6264)